MNQTRNYRLRRLILSGALLLLPPTAHADSKGAMVYKDGRPQTISPGISGIEQITFDKVLYDTCGCWSADRNRFVIPRGTKFVRLRAQAIFQHGDLPSGASSVRQIVIKKNFVTQDNWYEGRPGWAAAQVPTHVATTVDVNASGPVLPVQEGDTFVVDAFIWDGPTSQPVDIRGSNGTWFALEIVE